MIHETKREPFRLVIERTLEAPRDRVFDAFTRGEDLRRWSAPEGLEVTEAEGEPREGGRFRVVMREIESGAVHTAHGTYREITRPERIIHTHAWLPQGDDAPPAVETVVTVTFEEIDAHTTHVTMVHEGFTTAESRDGHEAGWSSCFDRLEALLAEEAR